MTPNIILVHSFKGGTGKTLASINLADMLRNRGKKTLLIEADFTMPAFHGIFGEHKPDIFFNDFLNSSETDLSRYIYPDVDAELGLIYCDAEFRADDKIRYNDQNWFRSKRKQLQSTIETLNYDYIIFDTQPGPHLFTINIITLANTIIVMLRPDIQSLEGTRILLDHIYSRSIRINSDVSPEFMLLFNQVPKIEDIDGYIKKWSDEFKYGFDFISKIDTLHYHDLTSYHTALQQFILPVEDPTKVQMAEVMDPLIE